MLFKQHYGFIIFCVFLAVILTYRLAQIPGGLNQDEVSFGLNGYLIGHTLHDENHHLLPAYFLTLQGTDWKHPVLIYWLAFITRILGLSIGSIRFGVVCIGLINTGLLYGLLLSLTGRRATALFGALTLGLSPLHFMQSRVVLDNIVLVFFILLWLLTLQNYLKTHKMLWLVMTTLVLAGGFYSYTPARIFMPLYFLFMVSFLWWQKKITLQQIGLCVGIVFIGLVPAFLTFWHHPDALWGRYAITHQNHLTPLLFLRHYLSYFSPHLLWAQADTSLVHSTLAHGIFLIPTSFLFVLGLIALLGQKKSRSIISYLCLIGFFTAPLAVALTYEPLRGSRIINIIPFYCIITALGFDNVSYHYLKMALFALVLLFGLAFIRFYFTRYPIQATIGYNYDPDFQALRRFSPQPQVYLDTTTPFVATYAYFYSLAYHLDFSRFSVGTAQAAPGDLILTSQPTDKQILIPILGSGTPIYLIQK